MKTQYFSWDTVVNDLISIHFLGHFLDVGVRALVVEGETTSLDILPPSPYPHSQALQLGLKQDILGIGDLHSFSVFHHLFNRIADVFKIPE